MTLSIAARCRQAGQFGVAVASSSPAVAARCAHLQAGVGAVLTQNITDPRLGPRGLDLLALGASAADAVHILQKTAPYAGHRQLVLVDAAGTTGGLSGDRCLGVHAIAEGTGAIAAGNLLADAGVPRAMIAAFERTARPLGDRILAAMEAGLAAGGEAGPVHSGGMLLADKVPWAIADLRVDWHDNPIDELGRLWALWQPQMAAYVSRALDPDMAPGYGVPGEA